MGSGPMRAAFGHEPIFEKIGHREEAGRVVGVLEGREGRRRRRSSPRSPRPAASPASAVTLLVAPTASLAGGVQVVARSVETALHKLSELGFDLGRVVSAHGTAPLPPVAEDDLAAIGRTNDAILYGARVVLLRHRRRRQPRGGRARRSPRRPRATTASPSPRSSPATTTTSTPSTPTSSARPRSSSRTSTPAASTPSAQAEPPTSWPDRSIAMQPPMTRLVALVSGFGWHVQDLAPGRRGARRRLPARPVPEGGRPGRRRGRAEVEAAGIDLAGVDGVLVRMMPPGSAGAGRLPDGRPAPAGGARACRC